MANFKSLPIDQFLTNLASKQPTPGGGAAAAIGGAVGSAAASMAAGMYIHHNSCCHTLMFDFIGLILSCRILLSFLYCFIHKTAYTQREKDKESGAAAKADELIKALDVTPLLQAADDDASAYGDLQRTWKESDSMAPDEKAAIEARALSIPTNLVESCHAQIVQIHMFMPHCNTNITSDAKVGIHMLAGSARAAYQVRLYLRLLCMCILLCISMLKYSLYNSYFTLLDFELILS